MEPCWSLCSSGQMLFLDVILLWEGSQGHHRLSQQSQQSFYSFCAEDMEKCFQLLSTFADRFVTFLLQSVVVAANHLQEKVH